MQRIRRGAGVTAVAALLAVTSGALAALPSEPVYRAPQAGLGLNPWEPAVGDFDGNGSADVAVTNAGSDTVSIVLNAGGGVPRPPTTVAVGDEPRGIAAADLVGDDALDLLVVHFTSRDLRVLEGNGDGTFSPDATYPLGGDAEDVATADLDDDGDEDAVVAVDLQPVQVLLNDGTGALSASDAGGHAFGASGVAIGDLDGDGNLDIAVASSRDFTAHVLLGAGDGTFTAGETVPTSGSPRRVALGDVDGDGDLDLATADFESSSATIGRNHGDGHFAPVSSVRVGSQPMSIAAGDLNGDGRDELVTANSHAVGSANGSWSVVSVDGGGYSVRETDGPRHAIGVVLARLNADALLDAVLASGDFCRPRGCFIPGKATILLNSGGGRLGGYGVYRTGRDVPATGPCIFGFDPDRKRSVSAGDLNGDGRPDLAVANCESNDVTLLLNDGFSEFAPGGSFAPDTGNPAAIAGGDLDGDSDRDLVVAYDASFVSVHLNTGAASFPGTPTRLGQALRRPFVGVEDMNGDGDADIVVGAQVVTPGPPNSHVVVWLNDGAGGFPTSHAVTIDAERDLRAFAIADLDGDGDKDVVSASDLSATVTVLRNDGTGRLSPLAPLSVGGEPRAVAAGDVDNDLDTDVAVADLGDGLIRVLLNDGHGVLSPGPTYAAGEDVQGVALADLDADGRLDLVYAQPLAGTHPSEDAVVRLNEGGTFGDPVAYLSGPDSSSVLVTQLNGSGAPELVVGDGQAGKIWVLINGRGGLFVDVDIDGVPDLFERELGLDPTDPDTDDDGIMDAIDPDVLRAMLERFPDVVFGSKGLQSALLAKLKSLDESIGKGDFAGALEHLADFAVRLDGCGTGQAPDKNDWIVDCAAQQKLQLPLALAVSNLKGVPLPKEFLPPPKPQEPPGN
jgi:hypothetical protein